MIGVWQSVHGKISRISAYRLPIHSLHYHELGYATIVRVNGNDSRTASSGVRDVWDRSPSFPGTLV
jgi:hypothetical protein